MMRISLSGVDCFPPPPMPEEPGYTYSVLIEGFVRAETVFIHHVGSNGRVREAVYDRSGRRFKVPVTVDLYAFIPVMRVEMADMPGHYAFVARDAKGKMRGRRDFWLWRDDAECARVMGAPAPSPMEELEQALAAETRRRQAAEQAAHEAHRAFERMRAQVAHRDRRIDQLKARLDRRASRAERAKARRARTRETSPDPSPVGSTADTSTTSASRPRRAETDWLGILRNARELARESRRERTGSEEPPPTDPETGTDGNPAQESDPCP